MIIFQIEEFTMQLMQNPLNFTANGFCTLNHKFIQRVSKLNISQAHK